MPLTALTTLFRTPAVSPLASADIELQPLPAHGAMPPPLSSPDAVPPSAGRLAPNDFFSPPPVGSTAHHIDAVAMLLRDPQTMPLADLLSSEIGAHRRAGAQRLDTLVTGNRTLAELGGHPETLAQLRELAEQARTGSLPSPQEVRETVGKIDASLEAVRHDATQPHAVLVASQVLDGIRGRSSASLAQALNAPARAQREHAAQRVELLLGHLESLASQPGSNPDDSRASPPLPPGLRREIARFVLEAGPALTPMQWDRLGACGDGLGLPVGEWMTHCRRLAAGAAQAVAAVREVPSVAGQAGGKRTPPPTAAALKRLTVVAQSAREYGKAVLGDDPAQGVDGRPPHRTALKGAISAEVRKMTYQEALELHRRLLDPQCVALRALARRALQARSGDHVGGAEQGATSGVQRQELEAWLAAFDELLAVLEEMAPPDGGAAGRKAGNADVPAPGKGKQKVRSEGETGVYEGNTGAAHDVAARDMFKEIFGFQDASPAG